MDMTTLLTFFLYAGLLLLSAGLPLLTLVSRSHKDVAIYTILLGTTQTLLSLGMAYTENITPFNATLNTWFMAIGLIMLVVGIAIYALKEKEHEDVARFSIAFGLLLWLFVYLLKYLGGYLGGG